MKALAADCKFKSTGPPGQSGGWVFWKRAHTLPLSVTLAGREVLPAAKTEGTHSMPLPFDMLHVVISVCMFVRARVCVCVH